MNKKCGRCTKTVYPTEEIKCLDQFWHKFCFKCEVCGMTLTMKNYKGYEKRPYCNSHYPKQKFTQVAETPEMKRIAENTKIQSNIKYHAEFEKQKGKKTSVVSDPETERIRQNTAIQSNIQYQNIAGKKHEMEARRPEQVLDGRRGRTNPGKISEYEPQVSPQAPISQYQPSRNSREMSYNPPVPPGQQTAQVFDSERGGDVQNGQRRQPGSISDYDPMAGFGSAGFSPAPPQPTFQGGYGQQHSQQQPGQQQPGQQQPGQQQGGHQQGGHQQGGHQQGGQQQGQQQQQHRHSGAPVYRAIYDYTAADSDEVSFSEGDIVINCEVVDAGWMTGTVKRTGQQGMLPSNYVEAV